MKEFSSTSASNEAGFTLLEILIAITLLAFITFGVVGITENAVLTKDRTTETNANNLQIETAMSRIEWDLSQIYSPLYFSTVMNLQQNANGYGNDNTTTTGGTPGAANGGTTANTNGGTNGQSLANNPYLQQYYEQLVSRFERNEHFSSVSKEGLPVPRFYAPEKGVFEFFTSSNRRKVENQKQSHFAWVRYSLASQEPLPDETENPAIPQSLKSLVRYFSADDPYSDKRLDIDGNSDKVKGAVLLRNVESLEFQYWDLQRRKWETSLRNIQQGESIIRGVKVLITWYDSTGNKRSTSRIFRTHWPLAVIQDQVPNTTMTTGTTANTNGGDNQTTGSTTTNTSGGTQGN